MRAQRLRSVHKLDEQVLTGGHRAAECVNLPLTPPVTHNASARRKDESAARKEDLFFSQFCGKLLACADQGGGCTQGDRRPASPLFATSPIDCLSRTGLESPTLGHFADGSTIG
jgi:hypothetical protein